MPESTPTVMCKKIAMFMSCAVEKNHVHIHVMSCAIQMEKSWQLVVANPSVCGWSVVSIYKSRLHVLVTSPPDCDSSSSGLHIRKLSSTTPVICQCFRHSRASTRVALSCDRDHEMVRLAPLKTRSDSALIGGALSTSRACCESSG